MSLATLRNGSIDGELIVVSKDLNYFVSASKVSRTLQHALDNWNVVSENDSFRSDFYRDWRRNNSHAATSTHDKGKLVSNKFIQYYIKLEKAKNII